VLWIVAGVWTTRSVAGAELDVAWGIAAVGAALRWGTLSLGDVQVATRLAGPTLLAGPLIVRGGMVAALVAAIVGECRAARFETRNWGERGAAAAALTVLVPLFVLGAPTAPLSLATLWWIAPIALGTLAILMVRPLAVRLPGWMAPALAAVGIAIASIAS
jgi:hypothetical protein